MEVSPKDVREIKAALAELVELIKGKTVDGAIKGGIVGRMDRIESKVALQQRILLGIGSAVLALALDFLRDWIRLP